MKLSTRPQRNPKVTGNEGNSFRCFTWKAKEQGNLIAFIVAVPYKIHSAINIQTLLPLLSLKQADVPVCVLFCLSGSLFQLPCEQRREILIVKSMEWTS